MKSRELNPKLVPVGDLLREAWDPIGRGEMPSLPANEYDSYVPRLVDRVRRGATDLELAQELSRFERQSLGLRARPSSDLLPVASALRAMIEPLL